MERFASDRSASDGNDGKTPLGVPVSVLDRAFVGDFARGEFVGDFARGEIVGGFSAGGTVFVFERGPSDDDLPPSAGGAVFVFARGASDGDFARGVFVAGFARVAAP